MCPRFCFKDTLLRDMVNGNEVDAMLLIAHTTVEFCSSEAAFTVVPAWSSPLMSVKRQIMGLLFGWSCMVLEQESANFFSRRLVCKYVWLWGPCVATTQLCHCSMRNWHIWYVNEWAWLFSNKILFTKIWLMGHSLLTPCPGAILVVMVVLLLFISFFVAVSMHAKSLQSCLTLCDCIDCSPSGSSVHGILQALECVAISSSRGSSQPKDQTHISYASCISRWVLYY